MAKHASKSLKVFIGCPGDLAQERDALLASRDHIESIVCPVKFTTWKMSASGVGEAQRVIFDNDPVESFDVVVIMIWSRLGVPSGFFDSRTKLEMTGTEAEFVTAYELHQSQGGRRPQVLLYRCARKTEIDTSSPKLAEQLAQLQAVQQFFKQTETGGLRPMLVQSFKTAEELKEFVTRDIKAAAGRLRSAASKSSSRAKKPSEKPKAANSGEHLHRYFAALRDQFSIYENVGLPVPERDSNEGEKDTPIPIRRLFVEPACAENYFSPEVFDTALREEKNPADPLLPRLAPVKSRTVLLADPGMGKSTLIQWLISTLADEAVPPDAQELRAAIPLPFILRDLVTHLPQEMKSWNWDALVNAFRQWRHRGKGASLAAPLAADDALFRSTLASANAFFLIDGLDEIGDPQRRIAVRNAIWEGFEKYPEARWLITSRIVGYEQAAVHEKMTSLLGHSSDFPNDHVEVIRLAALLHLAPFDDKQQLTFAQNWYIPRLGSASGAQRADDFMEAVRRHGHTRIISRVPNLLYLLALLFRHRARLPDGRELVYAAISSAYLADIDLGRHLPDTLVVPWKFEEKEELLALVAMRMQQIRVAQEENKQGEILVARGQLEEWLSPRFGGADDSKARAELNRFLDHIANRSGLLLPRGEGVFGFAHLSFQEYYAACFLEKEFRRILNEKAQTADGDIFGEPSTAGKEDQEKMFAGMAGQTAWHEPLLFLVEKLRHSAPDTLTFIRWAFPQLAGPLRQGQPLMPFTAAQLLAGISLDQEVSLDMGQRETLWTMLWRGHIAEQEGEIYKTSEWHLAPWLLAASAYQTQSLRAAIRLNPKCLKLHDCTVLVDLSPIGGPNSLEELGLGGCTALSNLSPLSKLTSLRGLVLNSATALTDLNPLSDLKELRWLWLSNCGQVSDLRPLSKLVSLQYLSLSGKSLLDLKPLERLSSLVKLVIRDYNKFPSLEPLSELRSLEWLSLSGSDVLQNLKPLAVLSSLETLWLQHYTALRDLSPLSGLDSLSDLKLSGCTKLRDLGPLEGLASLKTLDLDGCTAVSDLKPLSGLASLELLSLMRCKGVSRKAVEALEASLPKLKVEGPLRA